jgi:hypothetical protein
MLGPNLFKPYSVFDSLIAAFRDWARNRRLDLHLDECVSYEIASIAREVGLSPSELRRMSKLKPDAAKLLLDRMAALRLDPGTLAKNDPSTMRDLQRLCSNCASKKRCQRDLIRYRDAPVWRQYCPNVGTLDALQFDAVNARCGNKH